ncbi:hypothetical protein J2Z23_000010 [Lederbergia galactosidilyticus]|uniref:hypothetical protein n=1 Tax=Lederbergia galactosidilytica TaxID=217031 RepID=UPI001AE3E1CD|nr:hypothetical protein [Lederbergia galactosidilytica]MBP1913078.1 hypothetical protein [Lederbergia galactosidilytica]
MNGYNYCLPCNSNHCSYPIGKFAFATSEELETFNLEDGGGDFTILSIPEFFAAREIIKLDAFVQLNLENSTTPPGEDSVYNIALLLKRNDDVIAFSRELDRSFTSPDLFLALSWVDTPPPGPQKYELELSIVGTQYEVIRAQNRSLTATLYTPRNVLPSINN